MAPHRPTHHVLAVKNAEERAWDDWRYWVNYAWKSGNGALIADRKLAPKSTAGFVQVQAATAALRSALDKAMLAEKGKVQA